MQNSKSKQAFMDLDIARCKENWQDIPELTKKYKKQNPQESVLELSARMEAEYITTFHSSTNNVSHSKTIDFIHVLDDPNYIASSKKLPAAQVQLILFSKIIVARIYFDMGKYDKAIDWLQMLQLRLEDVESGYGLVLLVQARVIKARCFEEQNDAEALDSYMSALDAVESHPKERNSALNFWVEDCLYRSILLQLRNKGSVKQTLKLMRSYLSYCSSKQWPSNWRIYKRWVVFRHYIRYLTRAYQKGVYAPSDLNHRTLELCHLAVAAHDTIGWGPKSYQERLLGFFYQCREYTFNSLGLCRHLFHLHANLGQSKQASLALTSYLQHLGIPRLDTEKEDEDHSILHAMTETIQRRLQDVTHDSFASVSKTLEAAEKSIRDQREEPLDTVKRKAPVGAFENDHVLDVVRTFWMALKYRYVNTPEEGLLLSDMMIHLMEETEGLKRNSLWKTWMAQSRRIRGCFYGQYAGQCHEPEKRLNCFNEALVSLTKASEIDPNSWEVYYELGLLQATVGDLTLAVNSVKRSLGLKDDYLPSWHLLALLQSSGAHQDMAKAFSILQMAVQSNAIEEEEDDEEDVDHVFFEKAIALMKLSMTQLAILESLEGCSPDGHLALFQLYSRLSKKIKIPSVSQKEKNSDLPSRSQSIISSIKAFPRKNSVLSESSSSFSFHDSVESLSVLDKETKSNSKPASLLQDTLQENGSSMSLLSSKRRSKRSFSLSKTNSEDPLLSFPSIRKKKDRANSMKSTRSTPVSLRSSSRKHLPNISLADYQERWQQILVKLWILTSQSCLKNHQTKEALRALYEADQLTGGTSAEVWYQIGETYLSYQRDHEKQQAVDAFHMALALDPEHVLSSISLASIHLDVNKTELAEYLLEKTTKGLGWNQAEAWYLLSRVYVKQECMIDAKYCLMYALKLSETSLIHSLDGFSRFA
ncbi:hypothetical protein BY458DRAFT_430418 [Sporodiniella umbellata]|nr:hypothetical protein BY458DRAFT_430418 [Sporodiniella umbellata]